MDITEEQWEVVRPSIPDPETLQPSTKGGGPYRDLRDVLNTVLWILRTGAPWAGLPGRYAPYRTCHRRFQQRVKSGVPEELLRALAEDLRSRGKLDLTEAYVGGSHAGARRGALVGITRRGKATKIMAVADRHPSSTRVANRGERIAGSCQWSSPMKESRPGNQRAAGGSGALPSTFARGGAVTRRAIPLRRANFNDILLTCSGRAWIG